MNKTFDHFSIFLFLALLILPLSGVSAQTNIKSENQTPAKIDLSGSIWINASGGGRVYIVKLNANKTLDFYEAVNNQIAPVRPNQRNYWTIVGEAVKFNFFDGQMVRNLRIKNGNLAEIVNNRYDERGMIWTLDSSTENYNNLSRKLKEYAGGDIDPFYGKIDLGLVNYVPRNKLSGLCEYHFQLTNNTNKRIDRFEGLNIGYVKEQFVYSLDTVNLNALAVGENARFSIKHDACNEPLVCPANQHMITGYDRKSDRCVSKDSVSPINKLVLTGFQPYFDGSEYKLDDEGRLLFSKYFNLTSLAALSFKLEDKLQAAANKANGLDLNGQNINEAIFIGINKDEYEINGKSKGGLALYNMIVALENAHASYQQNYMIVLKSDSSYSPAIFGPEISAAKKQGIKLANDLVEFWSKINPSIKKIFSESQSARSVVHLDGRYKISIHIKNDGSILKIFGAPSYIPGRYGDQKIPDFTYYSKD